MPTKTVQTPWDKFRKLVQQQCNPVEYANWIAPILYVGTQEGAAVLQVPNIFVQEYLLDNYQDVLASFFPTDEQGKPKLLFILQEHKRPPHRPRPHHKPAASPDPTPPQFNPAYTFDYFIEGSSNAFIKSVALGIADHPGSSYTPFFIHGSVGLGKTHLMHAIGHYIAQKYPQLKIRCITTEGFINDLVCHLKKKEVDRMKRFYRSLDVLCIDDIQYLKNRLNFEEELCNTFESLINQSKQLIITSDKPPGHLHLSDYIATRMGRGLVSQIILPNLETRVAILQHKAEAKGLSLPTATAFYIAERIHQNVRQMEGALNRLSAYCRLMHLQPSQTVVDQVLGELFESPPRATVSCEKILQTVASIYQVEVAAITGASRVRHIRQARQVAMYLSKELLNDSLKEIGKQLGGKSHSTVLHGWKQIAQKLSQDPLLERQVQIARRHLDEQIPSMSHG